MEYKSAEEYIKSDKFKEFHKNRKIKQKANRAFKSGKTSGNYGTHEEHDKLEAGYRQQAKARALKNKQK